MAAIHNKIKNAINEINRTHTYCASVLEAAKAHLRTKIYDSLDQEVEATRYLEDELTPALQDILNYNAKLEKLLFKI